MASLWMMESFSSEQHFQSWLKEVSVKFSQLNDEQRNQTVDHIIKLSGTTQLHLLYNRLEQLVCLDFLKLLPPELREQLLLYLDPKTLMVCCCISRLWYHVISSSVKIWQNACRRYGFQINRDFLSSDGPYWKRFFIDMNYRRVQLRKGLCFDHHVYDRHLRKVTAVYYANGKLATASESKIIQLWDCETNVCLLTLRTYASVASIRFDQSWIIVSSYLGHLVSWDMVTGQRTVEYQRHVGAVFTFDYSKDLGVLVSGSSDTKIKFWSLKRGTLLTTLQEHTSWVLKVLLCSFPRLDNSDNRRHLMFSMDKSKVRVWAVSLGFVWKEPEGLYITSLYSIPLHMDGMNLFIPGLHFDNAFLYFVKQDPHLRGHSLLCKWNVRLGKMAREIRLNVKIKALLGIGKRYAAVVAHLNNFGSSNFFAFDMNNLDLVAVSNLPCSRPSTTDCSQLILGERDWLNGLDGKNDKGVLLAAGVEDNTVHIIKWLPRRPLFSDSNNS
ncbi:F-box/WD repeat-containing protein 2-like isoform X1 [Limulus polyphemus]|uniref:F-box/WD repeat-containing protein 2-like isoform X1 n=2 Tax=Limulus polyphemus TaxID=6850 RepID=A0ABM1T7I2_LIMPO|nr:F-box/WD repeat-containing protein 2-like isoform X1 [Limulus polyphemus]